MSNYTEPRRTQSLELTHSCATACVRACSRACVLRARSHVGIGGREGAPGVVRGRHVFRGGGDSLQQFYNCPTRWISCPLVGRDSRNTVAFPPTGIESILTPQSALPPQLLPSCARAAARFQKKHSARLNSSCCTIFGYNYTEETDLEMKYKCPSMESVYPKLDSAEKYKEL